MSVLTTIACMALVCLFAAAAIHPILTRRHVWRRATGSRRLRLELTERKEQLYASIKELEFDHSLGKMSPEDLEVVRQDLEAEAVEVLRHLDRLEDSGDATDDLEARIETEVAARRGRGDEPRKQGFCHGCGEPRRPDHHFCPHCGQSFTP
ncbi:MAG TPA: hypothetical protein QGF95_22885 [Candidatus Latescibacteria bacterium]|nr:hypothetical protein [Gemmatimonadaceae bacterium]HJP33405.1 hypothetical protein [Candidatus Latescibacterota bacterium]